MRVACEMPLFFMAFVNCCEAASKPSNSAFLLVILYGQQHPGSILGIWSAESNSSSVPAEALPCFTVLSSPFHLGV